MKINQNVLSIPPHISTTWQNVVSIHTEGTVLKVLLNSGSSIEIPGLSEDVLKQIFKAHTEFLENSQETTPTSTSQESSATQNDKAATSFGNFGGISLGFPPNIGDLDSIQGFGSMMQHNPKHANAPNIPAEMLEKVSAIAKAVGLDKQLEQIPKAEPHCNCPYCQLARAMGGIKPEEKESCNEEEVSEEDLKFKEWDIVDEGSHLYKVSNPLDPSEHFQVYLGDPLGCTCGNKNCEHIQAVLKS